MRTTNLQILAYSFFTFSSLSMNSPEIKEATTAELTKEAENIIKKKYPNHTICCQRCGMQPTNKHMVVFSLAPKEEQAGKPIELLIDLNQRKISIWAGGTLPHHSRIVQRVTPKKEVDDDGCPITYVT